MNDRTNDWSPDVARVQLELANRLRDRGVAVRSDDTPDEVTAMLEAVEEFERSVARHGGDLMMDEPPVGSTPQPDDPHFLLPKRNAGESAESYLERLSQHTAFVRSHRSQLE